MARTFTETFDTLANGTVLSTTNTAFDAYNGTGTWNSSTADADKVAGAGGSRLTLAGNLKTARNNVPAGTTTRFPRIYFTLHSIGATSVVLFLIVRTGTTGNAGIRINADRTCNLRDGTTNLTVLTTAFPLGQMVRMEYKAAAGVEQKLGLFWGANLHGTVPDTEIVGAFTATSFDNWILGSNGNTTADFSIDEVAVDDTASPGPVVTTITGSVSGTAPLPTSALKGAVRVAGSVSGTAALPAGSLTGAVRVTGSISGAAPAPTGALTGSLRITGSVAGAAPAPTGSLAGTLRVTGSLKGTTGLPITALSGVVRVTGAVAGTAPAPTGALRGQVRVTGTLSGAAPAATAALTGPAASITGSVAAQAPAPVAAFAGQVRVGGRVTAAAPAPAGTLQGQVRVIGAVKATTPVPATALSGTVRITGTVSGTVPLPRAALTGLVRVLGQLVGVAPLPTARLTDSTPPPAPQTPPERTLVVARGDRTLTVAADDRTLHIPAESRSIAA